MIRYAKGQQIAVKEERHETTQLQNEGFLAFKCLPPGFSIESDGNDKPTEAHEPSQICEGIRQAATSRHPDSEVAVEEEAIVSLSHAQKNTGYLDQWTHALKKMVWS